MSRIISKLTAAGTLFALPLMAGAQFGKIDGFFLNISEFINDIVVPFVFVAAFVLFIIGVARYFIYEGAAEEKEKAQSLMLWGILGFVLMASIWGIVNLLAGGLGEGLDTDTGAIDAGAIPTVPTNR